MFEWLGSVFMLRALRLSCKTQRVVRRARLVGWETIKSLLWHGDSRYDVIWLVINQQTTAQVLTPKYSIICCWIARCFYNKPISVLVLKINLSWSQHAISRNPPPTNLLRIWEICRPWGNNESIFFFIPHHRFFRTFVLMDLVRLLQTRVCRHFPAPHRMWRHKREPEVVHRTPAF